MRRSRSFAVRFASMLLLIVATQVTYAGEVCHSVMLGGMATGGMQHASAPVGDSERIELAMLPCCKGQMIQAARCLWTPTEAATTSAPNVFSQGLAAQIVAPVAAPLSRLQSLANPGLSPPPYLLFHRFLT